MPAKYMKDTKIGGQQESGVFKHSYLSVYFAGKSLNRVYLLALNPTFKAYSPSFRPFAPATPIKML